MNRDGGRAGRCPRGATKKAERDESWRCWRSDGAVVRAVLALAGGELHPVTAADRRRSWRVLDLPKFASFGFLSVHLPSKNCNGSGQTGVA